MVEDRPVSQPDELSDSGQPAIEREPEFWEFTFHPRAVEFIVYLAAYQPFMLGMAYGTSRKTMALVWAGLGLSIALYLICGIVTVRYLRRRGTRLLLQPGGLTLARPKRKEEHRLEGAVLTRVNWLGSGILKLKDGTQRWIPIPLHHPQMGPVFEEFLLAFEACGGQVRLRDWRGIEPAVVDSEVIRATKLKAFMRTKPDWLIAVALLSALAGGIIWVGAPWWIVVIFALVVLIMGADQGLFQTPFSDWRKSGAALSDTLEELRFEGSMVLAIAREEGKSWEADLKDCRLVQEIWQVGSEISPDWKERLTLEVGEDRIHHLEPLARSVTLGLRRDFLARRVPLEIRRIVGSGDEGVW